VAGGFFDWFDRLGQKLGFWDSNQIPTPNVANPVFPTIVPPVQGGILQGFDDQVIFSPANSKGPAYHKVGSKGNGPSMNGIRNLFDTADRDADLDEDFYTITIGGDHVQFDTGGLGGDYFYRSYKVQADDVRRWLADSDSADEFASKVAPPNRGWTGVGIIHIIERIK